ncbi:hypothetical protein GQ44DRAFT_772077 [Phaeosphaeriaceae sp. PMI808]|nr:hypothetical protein GQ44DRAFT_772077 [Phaeosphaeriaceae sp. PMI808]
MIGLFPILAQVFLGANLVSSLSIAIPTPLEPRDSLEGRETDKRDEVVYLTNCRKYKDKKSDVNNVMEHKSFLLYHNVFDYTRNNKTGFAWVDRVTPSFPKGQRVEAQGGSTVDWTLGKQDDRIEGKFGKLGLSFWVHSLASIGADDTKVTGKAELGDMDMRCYQENTKMEMTIDGFYHKCISPYYCTREQRQIRRTLFSFSEQIATVGILGKPAKQGQRDPRVDDIISKLYEPLALFEPKQPKTVKEYVIEKEFERLRLGKKHSIRFTWQAGQLSTDKSYDPSRIKLITEHLVKKVVPEIQKKAKNAGPIMTNGKNWDVYKVPLPANINVQIQEAFQDRLNWGSTDTIDIDIIYPTSQSCGKDAGLIKLFVDLFDPVSAATSGKFSAAMNGLGHVGGMVHSSLCSR